MLVSRPKAGTSADDHIYHKFEQSALGMSGAILTSSCAGRKLERENVTRPYTLDPGYLCTRCFTSQEVDDIVRERRAGEQAANRFAPASTPKMTIVWMDGKHEMYDLTSAGGWKVNTERQVLILGGRPPRMEFPLCNIRYYLIEPGQ